MSEWNEEDENFKLHLLPGGLGTGLYITLIGISFTYQWPLNLSRYSSIHEIHPVFAIGEQVV